MDTNLILNIFFTGLFIMFNIGFIYLYHKITQTKISYMVLLVAVAVIVYIVFKDL